MTRFGRPSTTARTVCRFGFQLRRVRRWEKLTRLPRDGPFPQISQVRAMLSTPHDPVVWLWCGTTGVPFTVGAADWEIADREGTSLDIRPEAGRVRVAGIQPLRTGRTGVYNTIPA